MIRKLNKDDKTSVLEYLYQDLNFNIFPIGDIETFGFESDFQRVYADLDEHGNYLSVFLRYRENAIFHSHLSTFNIDYLPIFERDPFLYISGKSNTMNLIKPYLEDFDCREMYFCAAKAIKTNPIKNHIVKKVKSTKDCERLYDLLSIIEEFSIYKKDKERFVKDKLDSLQMGTTLYIKEDDKMVSTVATTAETTKNAMVVAVATDPKYRNKGYATTLLLSLMDLYINNKKKDLCLFYDNPDAGKIYLRLGFENIGTWMMCDKK